VKETLILMKVWWRITDAVGDRGNREITSCEQHNQEKLFDTLWRHGNDTQRVGREE
jgi:hypothetical protein